MKVRFDDGVTYERFLDFLQMYEMEQIAVGPVYEKIRCYSRTGLRVLVAAGASVGDRPSGGGGSGWRRAEFGEESGGEDCRRRVMMRGLTRWREALQCGLVEADLRTR